MARHTVLVGIALAALAPPALAVPGDVGRVSVADAGTESPTGGFRGTVSGDGRHVLFTSAAELAGAPTGGKIQLYIRDVETGHTRLVSTSAEGAVANENVDFGDQFNPFADATPDGRYVVFASTATNLVPGDANGKEDVFRKDLTTGAIDLVSVSSAGAQGNDDSRDPAISGDGSRIAFVTVATNLVAADGNALATDVVLRDLAVGTTSMVSANSAGQQANEFTERPVISANGRVVAFEAGPLTTNLYENDTNAVNDVIVKNLDTGAAIPAAVRAGAATLGGVDVLGGGMPDISGDGRFVVFQSSGALDPANDANGASDVYLRDVASGVTRVVSARNGLATADGGDTGSISADGARVAFASASANLVAGDTNGTADVFVRTFVGQSTVRLSQLPDGTQATLGWETASIAGNGGLGAFTGNGKFSAEDANTADDVYATQLAPTDTIGPTLAARALTGAPAGKVRIAGSAADAAGVALLTVGGQAVRPAADGSFSADITATSGRVPVVAMDGAGVTSTVSVVVRRLADLRVVRRPTRVVVRFRLAEDAKITATLQRIVRTAGTVRYATVGTQSAVPRQAGSRLVRFARPRRGTYRVRLVATFAAGKESAIVRIRLPRAPG